MVGKLPDIKIILNESYIKAIKNSVGSNLFRNLFAYVDGRKMDILKDGKLSCALFVSSILHCFKLLSNVHATVDGTVRDLKKFGWQIISDPRPGSILVWEQKKFGSESHRHIGFYLGNKKAVSNNTKNGHPSLHHWTFGNRRDKPVRKVEKIFWNKKIEK